MRNDYLFKINYFLRIQQCEQGENTKRLLLSCIKLLHFKLANTNFLLRLQIKHSSNFLIILSFLPVPSIIIGNALKSTCQALSKHSSNFCCKYLFSTLHARILFRSKQILFPVIMHIRNTCTNAVSLLNLLCYSLSKLHLFKKAFTSFTFISSKRKNIILFCLQLYN